jgi:replicative DNA helicase
MYIAAANKAAVSNELAATIRDDKYLLIFSLEMSKAQIFDRYVLSRISGTSVRTIKELRSPKPLSSSFDRQKVRDIVGELERLPILFDDRSSVTTDEIERLVEAVQREHRVGLVVVDHIGLMGDNYGTSQVDRMTYISKRLAGIAKSQNVPILALSQLNRAMMDRALTDPQFTMQERRAAAYRAIPQLHHLRDSGALEQDATQVWFVHRPHYYIPYAEGEIKYDAYLIIAKCRYGEPGVIPLYYDTGVFSDWGTLELARKCRARLKAEGV